METVSASELVRRFGEWQERALTQPVYIRHHGRPRLVLASVDFLEHIVSSRPPDGPGSRTLQALLDITDAFVILTDDRLCVVNMSMAARHHLGDPDWHGRPLAELMPPPIAPIIARAVDQVRASAVPENLQLRIDAATGRRLDITVHPYGSGIAILARDRGEADARIATAAIADAVRETLSLLGDIAVLRINLRGYVTEATPSFAALCGLAPEAYRSVRAATLFDVSTRMVVSDAIERAIERLEPQRLDARLMVNRGETIDVRVAISAEPLRSSVEAIVATIARRA